MEWGVSPSMGKRSSSSALRSLSMPDMNTLPIGLCGKV